MVLSTVFVVSKDLANGVVSGKYFWFYLSIGLASIATLLSFIINRKNITFSIIDFLILIFCISGLAVAYYHNNTASNKFILLVLALVLYFYFRIFLVQYKWSVFILTTFFILTGLVEAIWGLKQLYGFSPSQHSLFKTTGSFFNPGPYAGYLTMVIPLAFYYLLDDYRIFKNKFRYIYILFYIRWGVAIFSFISIILILPATMSRASWIAAIVGCLIGGLLYLSKRKKFKTYIKYFRKKLIFILSGTIILSIIGLISVYNLKKDSADGRALIWKVSTQVIKEYLLGVGLGNFSGKYGDKQAEYFSTNQSTDQEQLVAGNPEYAFNEYLQICIEFGIIPFLVFISAIIYTIYIGIKRKNYAATGAFISLLIFAFMSYPFGILPFLISSVFLIALCSLNTQKTIPFHFSKSFLGIGIFILILFFLTILSLYNRYPLYDAYKRWSRIKILYNVNSAENTTKEYVNLYPYLDHETQFLFEYAQCLSKSEQYEKSNRILKKAMKISCDPMLYNIMGKNYQRLGNYTMAEKYFTKAVRIVPSRLYPYYLLAKLYDEMGDKEKVCQMAEFIQLKEAKIHSTAVNEMREEMKSICKKYKIK
jgi:tetratricopeptide (TPR) repeat protein